MTARTCSSYAEFTFWNRYYICTRTLGTNYDDAFYKNIFLFFFLFLFFFPTFFFPFCFENERKKFTRLSQFVNSFSGLGLMSHVVQVNRNFYRSGCLSFLFFTHLELFPRASDKLWRIKRKKENSEDVFL